MGGAIDTKDDVRWCESMTSVYHDNKGIIAVLTAVMLPTIMIILHVSTQIAESYLQKQNLQKCTDLVAKSLVIADDKNQKNLEGLAEDFISLNCNDAQLSSLIISKNNKPDKNKEKQDQIIEEDIFLEISATQISGNYNSYTHSYALLITNNLKKIFPVLVE